MKEESDSVQPMLVHQDEEPLLLDHEADGIKELDNQLPRWWVWLFYLTIIFSVFYLAFYHVFGAGETAHEAYANAVKKAQELKSAAASKFVAEMDAMTPSTDQAILDQGAQTYVTLCAPCHRNDGGGLVGPNLCDDYWIHGAEFKDSLRIIMEGNPVKGMIAWKDVLRSSEVFAVASYIYTLRGSDPPNPKPREDQVTTPAVDPSMFE